MPWWLRVSMVLVSLLCLSCSSSKGTPDSGMEDGDGYAAGDGDGADGGDEIPDGDGDAVDGDEDPGPHPVCESLGLPTRPFVRPDQEGHALYDVAADFRVPTSAGSWRFMDHWTGCDVYLFIQDSPSQASGWEVSLWDRDVAELIGRLPLNTHVFFISERNTPTTRAESLARVQTQVDEALAALGPERQDWWRERIHFVTEKTTRLGGWIAQHMANPGWGVGVDRFQRQRYIGSYADNYRYDDARQWFAPNLSMAANEAIYYNFEAQRAAELESNPATVVTLFQGELLSDPGWAGQRGYAQVDLPDAETMAGWDTLQLELYLGCDGDGEYGICPAWDYLVNLYLCERDDPDNCTVEIGRWVTTYHREGRWVHDVSPLLPLLAQGGSRRFAFYTQQPYVVDLSLRFSTRDQGALRPVQLVPLFGGGAFDPEYNDRQLPVTVSIPLDASKVELATVISGHGMSSPGNCAEFCDVHHHFLVNDQDNLLTFPQAGTDRDCMEQVDQGTVPNQYGTWWYGRSGWCPGREVPLVRTDVTSQVSPGQDALIEYRALRHDAPYQGEGASIRLSSWLVIYR